jgi:broad specificity phosphatase PhoE
MALASLHRLLAIAALAASGAAAAQPTIVLVRHAELEGQQMQLPPDTPLSEAGRQRAERLAHLLSQAAVSRIYVTDVLRTQQTAQPLAERSAAPVTRFAKPDTAALVQALRQTQDGTVVVVGHSDTLPAVMAALGGPADLKFAPGDHAGVFIVTPRPQGAASVVKLTY